MGDYGFVRARNAKRGQQISVLAQGARNAPDIGALSKASDPKQNLNEFEQKKKNVYIKVSFSKSILLNYVYFVYCLLL